MAKTKTIEENFTALEELIGRLESNELTLEQAFKTYESGIKLVADCTKQLDKVEKQIIILKGKEVQADE